MIHIMTDALIYLNEVEMEMTVGYVPSFQHFETCRFCVVVVILDVIGR